MGVGQRSGLRLRPPTRWGESLILWIPLTRVAPLAPAGCRGKRASEETLARVRVSRLQVTVLKWWAGLYVGGRVGPGGVERLGGPVRGSVIPCVSGADAALARGCFVRLRAQPPRPRLSGRRDPARMPAPQALRGAPNPVDSPHACRSARSRTGVGASEARGGCRASCIARSSGSCGFPDIRAGASAGSRARECRLATCGVRGSVAGRLGVGHLWTELDRGHCQQYT